MEVQVRLGQEVGAEVVHNRQTEVVVMVEQVLQIHRAAVAAVAAAAAPLLPLARMQ